jgi:hypothetical protein
LHGRRLGPQVDGSNRADFFADTGGEVILYLRRKNL